MIERSEFLQIGKVWFYVSPEGTIHRIIRVSIIANGTRDLCIVRVDARGKNTVKKIADADKDSILYEPVGDILWINITPPYRGFQPTIILDIGYDKEHMKPLVKAMLKSGEKPADRGDQYDTYLGDNYWD